MRLAAMLLQQVQGCLGDMSFRALPDLLWTSAVLDSLTVVMWNDVVGVLMEQHWEVREHLMQAGTALLTLVHRHFAVA